VLARAAAAIVETVVIATVETVGIVETVVAIATSANAVPAMALLQMAVYHHCHMTHSGVTMAELVAWIVIVIAIATIVAHGPWEARRNGSKLLRNPFLSQEFA